MHIGTFLGTRIFRYAMIAVLAFSVGSTTVAVAASTGALQLPVFRLADGVNPEQYAKVDADGNVQVRVNNQPTTQQISGTVAVSNFPSTQAVSGAVKTTPTVATRGIERFFGPLDAGDSGTSSFTSLNASYINVTSISGDVEVDIRGSLGRVFRAFLGDNEVHMISLTQQIPVNVIDVHCTNVVLPCAAVVYIMGD